MRDRQTCVGCGKKSPETETNYTLISAQFGWRLTRYKSPEGALVVEWRCPTCWREYKRSRSSVPGEPSSSRGSQPPPPTQPPPFTSLARPPTPIEGLRPRMPSVPGDPRMNRPITPVVPADSRAGRPMTPVVPAPPRRSVPPSAPPGPPPVPKSGRPSRGTR